MSDDATTTTDEAPQIVHVPITKGKTTLAVSIGDIPGDVWAEVILQGLKVLLNRGTSKVTKAGFKSEAEMKAKAIEIAEKQLEMVMTSKVKLTGGKTKAVASRDVMTEARRLAKALVKDELKRQGIKPSHVEAKDITAYANSYLESEHGAGLIAKAEAALAERAAIAAGAVLPNVKSIAISARLVEKAAAKAAKDKAAKGTTLSAKQAGKVKTRTKGDAAHVTQH